MIGASAGGISAVSSVLEKLPESFPAAVLIVIHISPYSPGNLSAVIGRRSKLRVHDAVSGSTIEHGHVYVAPPDLHLLIREKKIVLARGPRENRSRPAIDALFRSAAVEYGPRVIAAVLTGYLDDGTSGLRAVKRCGGVAVVQDPATAEVGEMPRAAIRSVDVDHKVDLEALPALLERLTNESVDDRFRAPTDLVIERGIAEGRSDHMADNETIGDPSELGCPECGGPLWRIDDGEFRRYRCHVGHAYSPIALLASQSESIEEALWVALRTLEERTRMLTMLSREGTGRMARDFADRALESERHAQQIRAQLHRLSPLREGDQETRSSA